MSSASSNTELPTKNTNLICQVIKKIKRSNQILKNIKCLRFISVQDGVSSKKKLWYENCGLAVITKSTQSPNLNLESIKNEKKPRITLLMQYCMN